MTDTVQATRRATGFDENEKASQDKPNKVKGDASAAPNQAPATMGSDCIVSTLVDLGVEVIFGYPGGAVLPIYDALERSGRIRHILVRHEQAAVHAAEGYARATGKVGVVLVTSGPGATNAVTGLADALLDSTPIVCITGQVARHLIGNDAFQEADTVGITRPCTKHNYLVKDRSALEATLRDAFKIASKGRPGPVVVDIPKDVQVEMYALPCGAQADTLPRRTHTGYKVPTKAPEPEVEEAVRRLMKAERPVLYVGGGVISSGPRAVAALHALQERLNAPVTMTLMGLGAFPARHKASLGMLGMHGTYEANLAVHGADVLFAVGARFDDRVTGRIDGFSPQSHKIHLDIDRSSINKNVWVEQSLWGDAAAVLEQMVTAYDALQTKAPSKAAQKLAGWWQQIALWREKDCLAFQQEGEVILPQHALKLLDAQLASEAQAGRDSIIATEVGQHQMWAAQYLQFDQPRRWLTSGGLGTMGYGLPAAIGAQIACPDALVIDVAGDASIQMNIQELGTLAQYKLPVKILIMNNAFMGMVRQWQDLSFEGRRSESYSEALPDFVALAKAYGLSGFRIDKEADLASGIERMINTPGAVVVDCRIAKLENVFPMVPAGSAHNEMILATDIGANAGASDPTAL